MELKPGNQDVAGENNDIEDDTIEDESLDADQASSVEGDEDDGENSTTDADEGDQSSDSDQTDETGEEGKDEKDEQDDKTKYAFKKKAFQLQEERQKREKAEQKAAAAEAKLAELTKPKRPIVPDYPDPLDPLYQQKLKSRDEALIAQQKYDNDVASAEHQKKAASQDVVNQMLEGLKQKQTSFQEKITDLGLDAKDIDADEKTIIPFINSSNAPTAEYILGHDNGPLIVKYLANDPIEMDKVSRMTPMNAAVYINNEISPKAEKYKPATTKTPAPAKVINGRSKIKQEDPMIAGATFE
jgi:hypothetical protein